MDCDTFSKFSDFDLDNRILRAINEIGYNKPTDVQIGSIPLLLEKKNLLIAARTGSGKTAAYIIPITHHILLKKNIEKYQKISAVFMCPSKELCSQTQAVIETIIKNMELRSVNVSGSKNIKSLQPILTIRPDFLVGTPTMIMNLVNKKMISIKTADALVIDEADHMCSHGYRDEVQSIFKEIDETQCQLVMLSATLVKDVVQLRKMVSVRWFKCELNESEMMPPADQLSQYVYKMEEDQKYTLLIPMFLLKLIQGKTIVFCNSVDKCYKLRLVLDGFSIGAVVLNSQLPVASRHHIIHQFNRGRYDILLASDVNEEGVLANMVEEQQDNSENKRGKTEKTDSEFKVSRGVDFHLVSHVINFDCPHSVESYIHRVGRTARVDQKGTALTFVNSSDNENFDKIDDDLKLENNGSTVFQPFKTPENMLEYWSYRVLDVKNKTTKYKVREAKLNDIKKEIMNSEKLKNYFQDNSVDMKVIEHNKPIIAQRSTVLKNIPNYLIPEKLQSVVRVTSNKKRNSRRRARGKVLNPNDAVFKTPLKTIKLKKLTRNQHNKLKKTKKSKAVTDAAK